MLTKTLDMYNVFDASKHSHKVEFETTTSLGFLFRCAYANGIVAG